MLEYLKKVAVLNDYGQPMRIEDVMIDPPRSGEVQVRTGVLQQ
jgi:Zn-dependent alcohol dehydrogenase